MREEFHGDTTGGRKLLYVWGTMHVNIWLPSLSELVGTTGTQNPTGGCYYSAMQGINISSYWHVDMQGGEQFAYFKQYNQSGGGEKIWAACNRQMSWLRSSGYSTATHAWRITNTTNFDISVCTTSHALHPVVDASSTSLAYPQRTGEKLAHCTASPLHKKARKAHLFGCKRPHDGSHLLPPFCGRRAYWK